MQIFSERLRELREEKQLSMATLSQKIGVSDAAICKWENDTTEPKASNIKILSEFFEVSSDYLLGLENENGVKDFSAPTKKAAAQELTTDERKLIEDYRSLAPYLQEMLQATIQTWKGTAANGKKNKRA